MENGELRDGEAAVWVGPGGHQCPNDDVAEGVATVGPTLGIIISHGSRESGLDP